MYPGLQFRPCLWCTRKDFPGEFMTNITERRETVSYVLQDYVQTINQSIFVIIITYCNEKFNNTFLGALYVRICNFALSPSRKNSTASHNRMLVGQTQNYRCKQTAARDESDCIAIFIVI